jgi:hypothetical protein
MYAVPEISVLFPQKDLPAVYAEGRIKALQQGLQIIAY